MERNVFGGEIWDLVWKVPSHSFLPLVYIYTYAYICIYKGKTLLVGSIRTKATTKMFTYSPEQCLVNEFRNTRNMQRKISQS